jgi:hypothetical protein
MKIRSPNRGIQIKKTPQDELVLATSSQPAPVHRTGFMNEERSHG